VDPESKPKKKLYFVSAGKPGFWLLITRYLLWMKIKLKKIGQLLWFFAHRKKRKKKRVATNGC
jgi:hypothetical protein